MLTVGPWGSMRGLLGTCNLVMAHGQVALDEKLLVFWIEDCLLDVLAGKAFNRSPGLPEAHRDELGTVTVGPPKQPGPAVAGRALVILDAGPLHIRRISGSVLSPDRPAPGSRDHPRMLSYLQALPARRDSAPRAA